MHSESTQGKLASQKKTSRGKVSRRSFGTIAKKNNLEKQRRNVLSSEKEKLIAVITPTVINHLS